VAIHRGFLLGYVPRRHRWIAGADEVRLTAIAERIKIGGISAAAPVRQHASSSWTTVVRAQAPIKVWTGRLISVRIRSIFDELPLKYCNADRDRRDRRPTAPGALAQGTPTSPGPATGIKPDRTIADPATQAMREKRAA
jgi:hypothetical protein